MDDKKLREALTSLAETHDTYLFSGDIDDRNADALVQLVHDRTDGRDSAALYLTTYGGDPHSAYRIGRALRRNYKTVRLLIAGPCKSAGTLVALAADELVIGPFGELGPLDVQLRKDDEIVRSNSGLDVVSAISTVSVYAFRNFEEYMLNILRRSDGGVSTRTACDVASALVTNLYKPITAQIDPLRLGEVQRAIRIAKSYGERLGLPNARDETLDRLVEDYPAHGFVIDYEEAKTLFYKVDPMEGVEATIAGHMHRALRHPSEEALVVSLDQRIDELTGSGDPTDENTTTTGIREDIRKDVSRDTGPPKPVEPAGNGSPVEPAASAHE